MLRPALLLLALCLPGAPALAQATAPDRYAGIVETAAEYGQLNALIIAEEGEVVVEERLDGPDLDTPVNIKSAAKSVISALAGIAIERGIIAGTEQPIVELLRDSVPADADPRLSEVTVGDLLSMQAGLDRTSGGNYGAWVQSGNWVRYALSRPFVDEPGGAMLYSTGNSHLLSAILTRASGRSTLALARDWLGEPLGIDIPAWQQDPQGIYFGGNNMALSPRALLRFGELYRQGGTFEGSRVLPEGWVEASFTPRTSSRFTGDSYGYGWFSQRLAGEVVHYAWGYGGQMVYVAPGAGLTVVVTSDPDQPSGRGGYVEDLHELMAQVIRASRDGAAPGG